MPDTAALRDGKAPQVTTRGLDVDGVIEGLAVAQVKCSKAGACPEKVVEVNRAGGAEVDNLERRAGKASGLRE